jgi:hypothetical protein
MTISPIVAGAFQLIDAGLSLCHALRFFALFSETHESRKPPRQIWLGKTLDAQVGYECAIP